jgi:hypothetical protein
MIFRVCVFKACAPMCLGLKQILSTLMRMVIYFKSKAKKNGYYGQALIRIAEDEIPRLKWFGEWLIHRKRNPVF